MSRFLVELNEELRQPLAMIIETAERLKPDMVREAGQVIVRNARMLMKRGHDLLEIAQLEAGSMRLDIREVDITALVRCIAEHFDIVATERDIDFRVETPATIVIAIDPAKLRRVVMNLLSNAFKFVPTGGSVRCTLALRETDVMLSVDDSGPGVAPELRHAILERRVPPAGGVGLAIAHDFMRMHGGTMAVTESDLGGARVEARLRAEPLPG